MNLILKGNICYSQTPTQLKTLANGYLVCEDGVSRGVFSEIPAAFKAFPLADYGSDLIIPGLTDLHLHAPQYAFRGLGMDLELLDWLNTHTFPEEGRYADLAYAEKAYDLFVDDLARGATTRAAVFATLHLPATLLLMEKLERSGLVTLVGKVNMDRNAPDFLREESAQAACETTRAWLDQTLGRFKNTAPILSPRFIPTCSDPLMDALGKLQREYGLPVQSHLSENRGEIDWVRALCPEVDCYGGGYNRFGLFGGAGVPTIMAHCVWSAGIEEDLLFENGVYVAHCPQSNINLSSGIAPVRRFINRGIRVGLGTDVAGGCHPSILRAMSDAIQVSKLYWRLVDQDCPPLTVPEAFYLGTLGGGSFFGKVGSFEAGYELDAVLVDDSALRSPGQLSVEDRLARIIYLSEGVSVRAKYVCGRQIQM